VFTGTHRLDNWRQQSGRLIYFYIVDNQKFIVLHFAFASWSDVETLTLDKMVVSPIEFTQKRHRNMKQLPLYLFSFLLIAISSCTSQVPQPMFVGEWEWVDSGGGFTGASIRPPSGSTTVLRFGADKTVTVTTNGNKVFEGTYETDSIRSIYRSKKALLIKVSKVSNSDWPSMVISGIVQHPSDKELLIGGNRTSRYSRR
jgi:hypothetical protein